MQEQNSLPGAPSHRRGVAPAQRFNRRRLCPVCGGHPQLPRGGGVRCAGYFSPDRVFAHCSREEHAGHLRQEAGGTFAHKLEGDCACGVRHDKTPPTAPTRTERGETVATGASRRVAEYVYRNAAGDPLFRVVRFEPKTFINERPDADGRWVAGRGEVEAVPYRLPELVTTAADELVYLPEGEKDVEAIVARGGVATTFAGGASTSPTAAQLAPFRGKQVVVLPDNDEPGRRHAGKLARALRGIAASVTVVALPDLHAKGDVSDWFAAGGSITALRELVDTARARDYRAVLVRVSDVAAERVRWLWKDRLAFGKVALGEGNPGQGKSTFTLDLAARLTTGRPMPGETLAGPVRGVVLLSLEDAIADTIRPRLEAAGADLERVFVLTGVKTRGGEDVPVLPAHLDVLEEACRRVSAGLIVIDPFMAYLDPSVDSHKDQHVRRALAPLCQLAERMNVAVLIIRHLNKASGGDPMYRGGGSIGIIGAVRSSLIIGRDPADEQARVVALNKSNNGPDDARALRFKLENTAAGVARIVWLGECDLTAADVLGVPLDGEGRSALGDAQTILQDLLANGPMRGRDVQRHARDAGVSDATLGRARSALRIVSRKVGYNGETYWAWSLPDTVPPGPVCPSQPPELFSRALIDEATAEG